MSTTRVTRDDKARKERIPVSSRRAPLVYRGLDTKNFVQRWVLDKDDRILRYLEGGWEFIKQTAQGTVVGDPTVDQGEGTDTRVKKHGSNGKFLYLMQIKKEWYEEDQAKKQKEIDELEATMRNPIKVVDGEVVQMTGSLKTQRRKLVDVLNDPDA